MSSYHEMKILTSSNEEECVIYFQKENNLYTIRTAKKWLVRYQLAHDENAEISHVAMRKQVLLIFK